MKALIERYGQPNKYDQVPYDTLCKVRNGEKHDIYRQASHDTENPDWVIVEFPEDIQKRIPSS